MSFIKSEKLSRFPETMLKLREDLGFTQKALLEDNEFERRMSVYNGLVERGIN